MGNRPRVGLLGRSEIRLKNRWRADSFGGGDRHRESR